MVTFRKQEDCPSSEDLLSYQLGDLEGVRGRDVGRHLSSCEFCSSEVDFYEHYPVAKDADESAENVKMPKPLFELAEAILNRKRGSESIEDLMKDMDSVVQDKR